ncbi:hypothetical protein UFOVP178_34 [uncultured Caudovirales phage]|uniref:Uncharacterized protein n=1 Tax=uncultured Caudovirales phage TaxID=2100421 RepID=A0A6J7WEV5_9CAUD|nr:hypothetical protein UFOVP178_34 [uncultured Caudovirales phage]
MGKPLDKQLVTDVVLNYVRSGLFIKQACLAAGVGEATFRDWRRGDPSLSVALKKAEAEFERVHIQNITTHAAKDWKASAWMLERKYPQRYAKREAPEVRVRQSVEVSQPVAAITVSELQEAAVILEGLGFKFDATQREEQGADTSAQADAG